MNNKQKKKKRESTNGLGTCVFLTDPQKLSPRKDEAKRYGLSPDEEEHSIT